ncbi:hypothetical protein BGX20_001603, partial [Mortierella sp. AD010]
MKAAIDEAIERIESEARSMIWNFNQLHAECKRKVQAWGRQHHLVTIKNHMNFTEMLMNLEEGQEEEGKEEEEEQEEDEEEEELEEKENEEDAIFRQYAFIIGPALAKLKSLICGGEQGTIESFSEVVRHRESVRLINAYGPTEATVNATTYEFKTTSSQLDRLPIGRPISNTKTYVLDKNCNPVPIGVVGELYIGGPGVANGYLNRPDLTAERFLPDPFSNVPGARMYKSGDMVRYLPDGNIVFMGRNDDQVKIRGFRVELGEIEVRLAEHPQVREVLVLAIGESSGDKRLVAYVVATPDENLISSLREHLVASLPEYMVPSAFVRMDAFPLTNNGKIDRRALPLPDASSLAERDYQEPQGKVEIELANVWSELLK